MGAKESKLNGDPSRRNIPPPGNDSPQNTIPPPPPRSALSNTMRISRRRQPSSSKPPQPPHPRPDASSHFQNDSSNTADNNSGNIFSSMRRKFSNLHQSADIEPRETPRRTNNPPQPQQRRSFFSFLNKSSSNTDTTRRNSHSGPIPPSSPVFLSHQDTEVEYPLPPHDPGSPHYLGYFSRSSPHVPVPPDPFGMENLSAMSTFSFGSPNRHGPVHDIGYALANLDAAHKQAEQVFNASYRRNARRAGGSAGGTSGIPPLTSEEESVAQTIFHDVVYAYNIWHRHAGLMDRDVQGHVTNLRHNLDVIVAYLKSFEELDPFWENIPPAIAGLGGPAPTGPVARTSLSRFSSTDLTVGSPPELYHGSSSGLNEEVEEADVEGVVYFITKQLEDDPHGVPRHPQYTYWDFKRAIRETKSLLERIVDLLQVGLEKREATFNPLWVYLCSTALDKQSEERKELSREIKTITCQLMSKCKGDFTHHQRRFLKFCLAFCYPQRYDDLFYHLQEVARGIVCELQLPLIHYYEYMKEHDSLLLDLEVPADFLYGGSKKPRTKAIQSQRDVLPATLMNDLDDWYQRERLSAVNEEKSIDFYKKWGFEKDRIEKLRMKDGHAHGGRIVLNMFKQIAEDLRPSFQHFMAHLYQENLAKFNYDQMMPEMDGFMPDDDRLYDVCGARAPSVKSISRALHKAVREFGTHPDPREAFILSYLRSVIVFRTERELNSFFHMLLQVFKGKIISFFNGFSREVLAHNENNECRVVTMHVLYEHPKKSRSEQGRRMIVEIQMLLSRFFVVHRKLHLYHKVVRAKEQWAIGRDFSKMWDL